MLINGLAFTAERNATFERCNPLVGTVAMALRVPAGVGLGIGPWNVF